MMWTDAMTTAPLRRPFAVERMMARRQAAQSGVSEAEALARLMNGAAAPGLKAEALPAPAVQVDMSPVLAALERIESKLETDVKADHEQITLIQTEIADISGRIRATKAEIAALRHPRQQEDKINVATSELGRVVSATETATEEIMASAEIVDDIVREVLAQVPEDSHAARRLHDAQEAIIKLYEACNFQDLTGQRISKVVRALNFIEERVDAMLGHWNEREIETFALAQEQLGRDDGDLHLEGPASSEKPDGMDQAAIDALFG